MNTRRYLLGFLSAALTAVFIALLFKVSKLDIRVTIQQLHAVSWASFAALILLTASHVYLSSVKWRLVDARLRDPGDAAPSRKMSFAVTSVGVALGQLLPVQLSMSLARTMGTYVYGRALKRGTGGTLFEQTFDVVIVGFLTIASAITLLSQGSGVFWVVAAAAMVALAMALVGPIIGIVHKQIAAFNDRRPASKNKILRSVAGLQTSGLLDVTLGRQLMALSTARFAIQVLMAGQAAQAVGVHIPLWHFAAAMPFVILACVIVVTPAGLGVNELSYATTLHMFGTPLHTGGQWALANRLLVASSCLVVALCAMTTLGIGRLLVAPRPTGVLQKE